MRCRHAEGRMVALLREELDTAEALAVGAHLETCSTCRARLARVGRLNAHLAALPLPPIAGPRRDRLRERMLAALDAGAVAGHPRQWRRLGPAVGVAALAAALLLWLWPHTSRHAPGPTAPGPAAVAAKAPAAPLPAPPPTWVRPACGDGVWTAPCVRRTGAVGVRADLPGVADLWLEPGSVVALESTGADTRFRLERGRVLARVRARPAGSSFVVAAGDLVATVHGTLFAVARGDRREAVELVEGTVTVAVPGQVRALAAGERAVLAAGRLEVEPLPSDVAAADRARLPAAPASADAAQGPAAVGSPERYYRRAEAARRAGRSAEAARAYGEIRRLYPGTAAAANASLAQGDLFLGPLHRPDAAVRSYDEALAGRPLRAVREEALAGRARALQALSRSDQARAAASAYLRSFPAGIHAPEMRALAR